MGMTTTGPAVPDFSSAPSRNANLVSYHQRPAHACAVTTASVRIRYDCGSGVRCASARGPLRLCGMPTSRNITSAVRCWSGERACIEGLKCRRQFLHVLRMLHCELCVRRHVLAGIHGLEFVALSSAACRICCALSRITWANGSHCACSSGVMCSRACRSAMRCSTRSGVGCPAGRWVSLWIDLTLAQRRRVLRQGGDRQRKRRCERHAGCEDIQV